MADLIPASRGFGTRHIEIYEQSKILDPITGFLMITKDHHTVFEDGTFKVTLLSIPSQNVSFIRKIK